MQEEKEKQDNRFLRGRQIAFMIFDQVKISGTSETHLDFVDRTPIHNTHLCTTVCSQARHAHHAPGSSHHGLHFIFVRLKRVCHLVLHMSHPLLISHLPFTTSTSSSSFTLPSTTTQEHAAQPVQHDQLQKHPVHHQLLQALAVDKLRHQESLWRENLQSGGNPRTTTPPDFNDLLRVQLKTDNVQGFDTKWGEVLVSMTKVPSEDTLDTCTSNSSITPRN